MKNECAINITKLTGQKALSLLFHGYILESDSMRLRLHNNVLEYDRAGTWYVSSMTINDFLTIEWESDTYILQTGLLDSHQSTLLKKIADKYISDRINSLERIYGSYKGVNTELDIKEPLDDEEKSMLLEVLSKHINVSEVSLKNNTINITLK